MIFSRGVKATYLRAYQTKWKIRDTLLHVWSEYLSKQPSVLKIMWIAAKFFLCVCLFPTDVFSGNERSHTEDNTESHQKALEEFPTLILEEVLGDYKLLREEVLALRTTHFLMQAEINELKENQRESAKRITEIEHENIHLRKENSYLRRLTKDANTKNHLQNGTFQQNHISKRLLSPAAVVPSTSQIAFSTLMNSNIVDPHDNKIFMFDNIIVNSGNAYNKNNGMFTAPVKGIYAFFATVLTFSGKSLESQIVRNGRMLCNIYSGDNTFDGSGSNMAITHLEVGDAVWVKIHDIYHDTGVTVDGPFTTFSGFLLYETD